MAPKPLQISRSIKCLLKKRNQFFFDEFGVQFFDDDHSSCEGRFLMLGMSSGAKLLIVCHCERDYGAAVRIIAARKATKRESAFY